MGNVLFKYREEITSARELFIVLMMRIINPNEYGSNPKVFFEEMHKDYLELFYKSYRDMLNSKEGITSDLKCKFAIAYYSSSLKHKIDERIENR